MMPEKVAYYRAMLLVGIRDRFDAAFDEALEAEEPLSDLMLSLCTCISDNEQVLAVLQEYLWHHTVDAQVVYHLIRGDIGKRHLAGQMTRSEVTELLYQMVQRMDKLYDDPWYELTRPSYALELWQGGMITENVFNQCFDAWLFRGETPDPWQLRSKLNEQ